MVTRLDTEGISCHTAASLATYVFLNPFSFPLQLHCSFFEIIARCYWNISTYVLVTCYLGLCLFLLLAALFLLLSALLLFNFIIIFVVHPICL